MATIVFAGGGTAGHIEPALAVARCWKITHPNDRIVFIGTKSGLENSLVPLAGFELVHIPRVVISRKPSASWFKIPTELFASVRASRLILSSTDLLIGFGGYVSGPAYIAARYIGIPTVIHEANVKAGWANRLGALLTPYLAAAHHVESREFTDALITGLPLRSDVAQAYIDSSANFSDARKAAKRRLGFQESAPLIFVMGGSQGSVAINAALKGSVDGFLSKGFSVLHSVGKANTLPPSHGAYRAVPYVEAMADAYLASDLVIARSGAVTCSEFRTLGRYGLFVPLPIGNGEQFMNARSLVSDGKAQIIEQSRFDSNYLLHHIDDLLSQSQASPVDGSGVELDAAAKIVALGEHAMGEHAMGQK